jgi:hypothetical protein
MTPRRLSTRVQAIVVVVGMCASAAALAQTHTPPRVIHVVARVRDSAVAGLLSPADLAVREDGRQRTITAVALAPPGAVALVVDPALGGPGLGAALVDFLAALGGRTPVTIFSADGERIGGATPDTAVLTELVRTFHVPVVMRASRAFDLERRRPEGRTAFLPRAFAPHGILSAVDELVASPGRPGEAIVAVIVGGGGRDSTPPPMRQRLLESGASLRAAVFVGPNDGLRGPLPGEETMVEGAVTDAAISSGGRREFITRIDRDLAPVLLDFAADLTHQYAVSYLRPVDTPAGRGLEVRSTRSGLSVSGPRRAP